MYPQPLGTSVTVGAAIALAAPAIAVHDFGWVYAIGVLTAAAAMAVSIPLRNIVMLAFGSCALFGYITATVIRYADRTLNVAEILMVIGGLLIGLAVATVRLSRAAKASGPGTGPASAPRAQRPAHPERTEQPVSPDHRVSAGKR